MDDTVSGPYRGTSHRDSRGSTGALGALALALVLGSPVGAQSFVNFEVAPVHPLDLTPSHERLLLAHGPSATLQVFDVTGAVPQVLDTIPVGLEPVAVRARGEHEAWVVNQISDSVSVVDLDSGHVRATLAAGDEPSDVVFAGDPPRAFVTSAGTDELYVFDPADLGAPPLVVPLQGNEPRALDVSPDGSQVVVAFFMSGNGTTTLVPSVAKQPDSPYAGVNPFPNAGAVFDPPMAPELPPAPAVAVLVRQHGDGTWLDDNGEDWSPWVSGEHAAKSGRVEGWRILDHDLALVDADTLAVQTVDGLMTHDMAVAVNPVSGRILTVGQESINEVRFEPVLRGVFVRVVGALVEPDGEPLDVLDLNPHLDYTVGSLPLPERQRSLGDVRAVAWSADGARAFVAGMGSGNVAVLDANGQRVGDGRPIAVGDGPAGLVTDDSGRLFVFSRFEGALSVVDPSAGLETARVGVFDPTPDVIRAGRAHLYDTHATSGLGQASCASCHVDARSDGLAWDLGNPAGALIDVSDQNLGAGLPVLMNGLDDEQHPMKGPMLTQTLQDIIGAEPFHWRGDKDGLEAFNPAYPGLLGADAVLSGEDMAALKAFLATIHYAPNPFRELDNSLSTSVDLAGLAFADGTPMTTGDAAAGLATFMDPGTSTSTSCSGCHTTPTGVGTGMEWTGVEWVPLPPGPQGEHHATLMGALGPPLKIPNLRDMREHLGLALKRLDSTTGFGANHDGTVSVEERLERVAQGLSVEGVEGLAALILSFSGGDLPASPGTELQPPSTVPGLHAHAAVGVQATLGGPTDPQVALVQQLLALADAGRVGLVARGELDAERRGFAYLGGDVFQSDRAAQQLTTGALLDAAAPGRELTFTAVPAGSQQRLGIDRDEDGHLDRDELDAFADPSDPQSVPGAWLDLGEALAGSDGVAPRLVPGGSLQPGAPWSLQFQDGLPGSTCSLVIGVTTIHAPFKGGVLVPAPDLVISGLPLDGSGALLVTSTWPAGLPSGVTIPMQIWVQDPGAAQGFAASNAVGGTTP